MHKKSSRGFTLIELSIVLVIIGLIVGGVLVGRDLITASTVRAQISQIEKYNTAVNTFRGKYGALPGDLTQSVATQFNFASRGTLAGQGDGNGQITGVSTGLDGTAVLDGENIMFWVDLSTANLIDGGFTKANATNTNPSIASANAMLQYIPAAKIGRGNNVYVWSGGWQAWYQAENGFCPCPGDGINYFGLSAVPDNNGTGPYPDTNPALTVAEAYNIDKKIDDGMPQTGTVTAMYDGYNNVWAAGGGGSGASNILTDGPTTASTPSSATTCYDNGSSSTNAPQQYSMTKNNGAGINCALSFKFQ